MKAVIILLVVLHVLLLDSIKNLELIGANSAFLAVNLVVMVVCVASVKIICLNRLL